MYQRLKDLNTMSRYIRDTMLGECIRLLSVNKFLKFPDHIKYSLRDHQASNIAAGLQKYIIVNWYASSDVEVPLPHQSQEAPLTDGLSTIMDLFSPEKLPY